ncbi:hypothetical protein J6590_031505 [Homalodisca vitripennis]|nr:hypothetical protein J6590_031505 [Homalodisca vitripennis]
MWEELNKRYDSMERDKATLSGEVKELRQQLRDADEHSRATSQIISPYVTHGENITTICRGPPPPSRGRISPHNTACDCSPRSADLPVIAQFVARNVKGSWLAAVGPRGISTPGTSLHLLSLAKRISTTT